MQFEKPDGKTSLWDEGADGERRRLIILALALQRPGILKVGVGPLRSHDLPEGLVQRLLPTEGDTPLVEARQFHYELQDPVSDDYRQLASAVLKRGEIFEFSAEDVKDLLEDEILLGRFQRDGVSESLLDEIDKMIDKRHITAHTLHTSLPHPIFDIREGDNATKIRDAKWIDPKTIKANLTITNAPKRDAITLYCENGDVSLELARQLRRNDYKGVRVLLGGFAAWHEAGLPTVTA